MNLLHPSSLTAFGLLVLAAAVPARAFSAAEDFSSYSAPTTFTNAAVISTAGAGTAGTGASGNGWLTGWRSSTSTGLAQTVGVNNSSPVNSGGNYLTANIVTKSDGADVGKDATSIARAYDVVGGGLAASSAVTVSFDFRVDAIDTANMRYDLFDNSTRGTGATSASYNFRTSNGVWGYFNGITLVETTMAFTAGTTYSFSIVLNPIASTYTFSLGNGVTSVSGTSAAFRNSGFATDAATGSVGGRWLTFNANETTNVLGQTTTFSVDNISISAVPEPSTYALFSGAAFLGTAALRRRSRR
ncbi:PEP-CTERM sorting domain-containing protein [Rariglobus hedericola]|uniref:PEP-CTERM sorting domain-containing protein n=1 Tax=Rariglobus hedericola TaxID=2597822 RepID=A0A556QJG3_9BACT|nr:PEP-CTERM sorting domain-containing protein [Rariglobus hedericola]TSJ76794.1 PEP-CTERM sorting domain-containing protein [Rariglobus hedericola]